MSRKASRSPLELFLFSPVKHTPHAELLTVIAHYHCTGESLGLGHTVNFGRPWMENSTCDHGLISLPYLDGPSVEWCESGQGERDIRCLWLMPITAAERDYVKLYGLDALERRFEDAQVNYVNPVRESVV